MNNTQLENCLDWNSVIQGDGKAKSGLPNSNLDAVKVSGNVTASTNSEADGLPSVISLSEYKNYTPKLSDELIQGVLRVGHKMLISGPSKAGKSFLLMELCIAIATGGEWLGFQCKKVACFILTLKLTPTHVLTDFWKSMRRLA